MVSGSGFVDGPFLIGVETRGFAVEGKHARASVEAGKFVTIVGRSGGGQTTLVKLMHDLLATGGPGR